MSAHVAESGQKARIRIKGHWQSVLRFFFIAVGFMMTWVLVSSELGYYSKWFGPSILLQLNFAFYIPSIPVLMISGQLEKFLDKRFGPIQSMAIRINTGLAGSLAICASFPFTTRTHSGLLWTVVLLGTLSAVAFSTSYQLVQWFRHADIIALGIGSVGCGPLVLLIQLGLADFTWPQRWQAVVVVFQTLLLRALSVLTLPPLTDPAAFASQWIAMFEISAAIVLVGLASSVSLFGQYWGVMTGATPYVETKSRSAVQEEDPTEPLLAGNEQTCEEAESFSFVAAGNGSLSVANSYWYNSREETFSPRGDEEERLMTLAMAPSSNIIIAPDAGMPFLFQSPTLSPHTHVGSWEDSSAPIIGRRSDPLWSRSSSESDARRRSRRQTPSGLTRAGTTSTACSKSPSPSPAKALEGPDNVPGGVTILASVFEAKDVQDSSASPFSATTLVVNASNPTPGSLPTPPNGAPAAAGEEDAGAEEAGVPVAAGEESLIDKEEDPPMNYAQETSATVARIWPVLMAFMMSVTVLYTIFPFFTYIPSSGLFGDNLSRVLFFTRIGADAIGRFAPRARALVTKSPAVLLTLAAAQVTVATLLIVYIKGQYHQDLITLSIIIFLWMAAGYINTCANILAPAMVDDRLCVRASALMALTFQVAHFAGLILAAVLVFFLYGDLAG